MKSETAECERKCYPFEERSLVNGEKIATVLEMKQTEFAKKKKKRLAEGKFGFQLIKNVLAWCKVINFLYWQSGNLLTLAL